MTPFERSRGAFDRYCAMGPGEFPVDLISRRQVEVYREDLSVSLIRELAFAAKALGEIGLYGAVSDGPQAADSTREEIANQIQSVGEALFNIATAYRLDLGELLRATRVRCDGCDDESCPDG
jgi:hypothetical protein